MEEVISKLKKSIKIRDKVLYANNLVSQLKEIENVERTKYKRIYEFKSSKKNIPAFGKVLLQIFINF